MRAPLAPMGWPRATPPPGHVQPLRRDRKLPLADEQLRREGLIQLPEINIRDSQPVGGEEAPHRGNRGFPHVHGIHADFTPAQDPGQGPRVTGLVPPGNKQSSGAIRHGRSVACCDLPLWFENRGEPRQGLPRHLGADRLVVVQLRVGKALRTEVRPGSPVVALGGPFIGLEPSDAALRRQSFDGLSHQQPCDGTAEPVLVHDIRNLSVPHAETPAQARHQMGRVGHGFAAADEDRGSTVR